MSFPRMLAISAGRKRFAFSGETFEPEIPGLITTVWHPTAV